MNFNPFRAAVRKAFAEKGEPGYLALNPIIEQKAAYQTRLDELAEKRAQRVKLIPDRARERGRALAREDVRNQRKGQRSFNRKIAAKAQNEITAANMARAAVGDFGSAMQRNVLVVAKREEVRKDA